jgi:hypothetical protein
MASGLADLNGPLGLRVDYYAGMVTPMNIRRQKKPMSEQPRKALDDIGGEPLAGSGFENEAPDPEFSEISPAAPEQPRPRVQ